VRGRVFCELRVDGVLENSREIYDPIDKGGPTSSSPCELNVMLSSSRSGVPPSFARSSKNPSISPAGCKAAISLPLPDVGPDVRHLARSEDGIARTRLVALVSDLDHVLALDDVEPLVLPVVQVPR
jgi:hypothetical protein